MKYLIYVLILSTALSGCKKKTCTTDINTDIKVELYQYDGKMGVLAHTVEPYSCLYQIQYTKKVIGSTITIKFSCINENSPCLTAVGPASALIDLTALDRKEYNIKFKLNGQVTKGTLTMNPYKLEIEDNRNIQIK